MVNYKIIFTKIFEKEIRKLNNYDKLRVEKVLDSIRKSPYLGKPLGNSIIREKKILSKKGLLYYS